MFGPELLLDSSIRLWVVLPIVFITFLVGIIRHYVTQLLHSDKKVELETLSDSQVLLRSRILRENGKYIPRQKTRDTKFTADMSEVLGIERCDLDINSNHSSHYTELYGAKHLVVRRGQPFNIIIHLTPGSNTNFKPVQSSFTLIVETGPLPREESDTKVSFCLHDSTSETEWSASAANDPSENTLTVSINSSPDAPIGLYSLSVNQKGQKTSLGQFILLFNAWCPRDAVYMDDETKREEYVLAQHGMLYRGTYDKITVLPWNFAQFEEGILDICLKILDSNPKYISDADKDCSARGNPVYVTRVLSAMINSDDDNGVVVAAWDDFTDGVHPSLWLGSADILRRWAKSGPVRYGQCWVFAAVACTVSRALGIPCRAVTNFESGHDTDANLVIERVFDANDNIISDEDTIWNFHVWVDCWMARPDLGQRFNGWQTCDPTPQETSEGVYCCGPASLKAIKEGELTRKYDAPFIFAEVNADVEDKTHNENGEVVISFGLTSNTGLLIVTKAVGSDLTHDITDQYKYAEGSQDERRVYKKAQHHNKLQQSGEEPRLHLKIKLPDNMIVGSNFEVFAVLINDCMDAKDCQFRFFATAVGYNRTRGARCGFAKTELQVPPGEETHLSIKLEYDSYGAAITSDRMIRLLAMAYDKQLATFHHARKTLVFDEPELNIKLEGEATVNQSVTVQLTLLNPLPEPLQDCSFTIEGNNLTEGKPIKAKIGAVDAAQEAKALVEFIPSSSGSHVLLVNFDSNKLKNIKGFISVVVRGE